MAEVALTFAAEKLGDLMMEKVDYLQGVEGQVKWLKCELERMQCFLQDASEKQANQQTIRKWISDIRDLAQDAEDIIDTFILKVDNPRRIRGLLEKWAHFPGHVYHLDRVGEQIKSIRARLEDLEQSRQRYEIQNLGEGNMILSRRSQDVELRRRLSPWQKDKHVVGLKEDVELLLRDAILMNGEGLSVATIVGMGGSGKSTLARIVYNHAAIADQFDRRAWVCVSSDFNPEEVIRELVLQLVEPNQQLEILQIMEKSPLSHLKRMLYERLQGKRYFIVVDDVWEDAHWEALASAFPDDEDKASRLLLTSRTGITTKYTRYVHDMKLLGEDQSWELFLKTAFVDNNNNNIGVKCPDELENIGREILKRCDGLPLAITVVGGLLAKQKQSKSEWERVLRGMTSLLTRRSERSVLAILELSYNNLPPHLKSCFQCLGFFKEDAVIRAKQLVQVWIAQGLIQQGAVEETMEEIGTTYLDELINRNMVQVKDMTKDRDRVKTCHIHDLLRELSITKANEEINFQILRKKGKFDPSLDKIRHCAIYGYKHKQLVNSKNQNKHIRSIFMYEPWLVDYSPSYWKSFELLRVLNIEGNCILKLPDAIGDLTGLRYLGLRRVVIMGNYKLPSSIGRLKNLQVLAVREGVKVPNVIWKLDSLRHLYMDIESKNACLKLDTLKNLQTLSSIRMSELTPEHLTKTTNLRKLGIKLHKDYKETDVIQLLTALATLENLVCLNLSTSTSISTPTLVRLTDLHRLNRLKLNGEVTRLYSFNIFPPNLSYLTLVETRLREDPMPLLKYLPELVYLKLDYKAYVGEELVITNGGFPRLEVLSLSGMDELRNMRVGNSAMPELKRLEIYECPALKRNLPKELSLLIDLHD